MMKNTNCRSIIVYYITLLLVVVLLAATNNSCYYWGVKPSVAWSQQSNVSSRRNFVQQGLTGAASALCIPPLTIASSSPPAYAITTAAAVDTSTTITSLMKDLKDSKEKLAPIPDLLEAKEWDKVRSILKVPPVNKLWNLGDSQNPVLQLAKETGNVDLFEVKEDLAYNLQMCDQLTYDNAFVYFQPGNGKYKIKEPQELSRKAMAEIQQIMDVTATASSSL